MSLPSLDNLRCFLAAARASNFRRAARTMALTPTAFGQRIKQLEEQIGARLFARTTRSVALTQDGLALVPVAERCLAAAAECARIALGTADQPPMELTVGTRHELGMSWVLPQRAALMRARPWLSLHLYFSSGPDLLLRVRTLDIDCAITSSPFADPKLESFQLHREDYVFVGASALLSRTPLVRAVDAARHTLFDTTPDMPLFRYWRDAQGGGDRLRFGRGSWLGGIDAIRDQVRAGNGLAVLPKYFVAKDLASSKLRVILPKVVPVHDYFRLVFRAADPRRSVFEALATDLAARPLT